MSATAAATVDLTRRAFWTPANLALVLDGRWRAQPGDPVQPLAGVSTDSRAIEPGQVFVALRGERFDGHAFVGEALEKGAACAIVDEAGAESLETNVAADAPVLVVHDTLAALQQLARTYRDVLRDAGTRVIVVVGSNGKTTTRHVIHSMLDGRMVNAPRRTNEHVADQPGAERPDTWRLRQLHGTQSPGSYNNHIGLPLTLLAAHVKDDFVVAEIGTNHPGEVAALAEIARPDAIVLTSVGREHLEFFDQVETVAREQASAFEHLEPGGVAFVRDEAWRQIEMHVQLGSRQHVVPYGDGDDARIQLANYEGDLDGATCSVACQIQNLKFEISDLQLPLLGRHNAINALAAIGVGAWMGVDRIQLGLGALAVTSMPGRLEPIRLAQNVTVLHDAYNANPDSAAAALHTLLELPATRRVLVVGDMLELGDAGPAEHRALGEMIRDAGGAIGLALFIGPLAAEHAAPPVLEAWPESRCRAFERFTDDLPAQVAELLQPGDLVLLKASRGMQLERLIAPMQARFG